MLKASPRRTNEIAFRFAIILYLSDGDHIGTLCHEIFATNSNK